MSTRAALLRRMIGLCLIFACIAGLTVLKGCADKSTDPDPDSQFKQDCENTGGTIVGSGGGKITVDQTWADCPIEGLTIDILPESGDFIGCFSADVTQCNWELPPGFTQYCEGQFGYDALSVFYERKYEDFKQWSPFKMVLSVPIQDISYDPDAMEILCGFYYDDEKDTWPVVLPAQIDTLIDTTMTIKFMYDTFDPVWVNDRTDWCWGVVDLNQADYDETLKPLLESIHGSDQWSALEEYLLDFYQDIVDWDWTVSCADIYHLRDVILEDMRAETEAGLLEFQSQLGDKCGPCQLTTAELFEDAVTYIELKAKIWYWELWVSSDANYRIKFMCLIHLWRLYDELYLGDLCNFECLIEEIKLHYPDFLNDLLGYYVSVFTINLINVWIEKGYIDCD